MKSHIHGSRAASPPGRKNSASSQKSGHLFPPGGQGNGTSPFMHDLPNDDSGFDDDDELNPSEEELAVEAEEEAAVAGSPWRYPYGIRPAICSRSGPSWS